MQNKYLTALRTRYADFGFSKEVFDRVALQRLKTIEKAEDIDSDVASPDVMILLMKEMQGSNDTLRSRNAQIQRELEDLKKPQQTPAPEENPFAEEMKQMRELLLGMQTRMAETEKKARNEAVIAEVHEKMKKLGCTNDYIRKSTLAGLEIADTDTADSIAEKFKSVYDENCKLAFGEGYVPPKGNNAGGKDEVDYASMVSGLIQSGAIPNK